MSKHHIFTKEQNEWMVEHATEYSYSKMVGPFNEMFGTDITENQLVNHGIYHLKLDKGTKKPHKFTKDQDEWIKSHLDDYTYADMVKPFNEYFGTDLTIYQIQDRAIKRLKLKKNDNFSRFKKGQRGNIHKPLPIGTERYDGFNLYVKIADENVPRTGPIRINKSNDPNWIRKDLLVWTEAENPLPDFSKGEMLIHLDKDKCNCDIDNLYLTTRKINFMLSKNHWHSDNPNITLAAIKWCEVYYAMKGANNGWET